MNKSKIDWCDSTWNPVTGCLHGCEYCYAERIAKRFGSHEKPLGWEPGFNVEILKKHNSPYPYDFLPTFHRYRLDEPSRKTKPQNIFVCSMADLFGDWVPDEWINEVFSSCKSAPQHTFLFLTKNPKRYATLYSTYGRMYFPKNALFGATGDTKARLYAARDAFYELKSCDESDGFTSIRTFYSIEPLLEDVTDEMVYYYDKGQPFDWCDWVIVGGQTGPGAVAPEKHWIQAIIRECRQSEVPLFLKNNLNWFKNIQEYPW